MSEPPRDILLILRPLADEVPPAVRLRQALKVLLRAFGLRCLSVEWLPAQRRDTREEGGRCGDGHG
jgi:hypothetical protein